MSILSPSASLAPEIISVQSSCSGVKCDGGSSVLGHPEVYYSFDGKPSVTCSYCGRVFVRAN